MVTRSELIRDAALQMLVDKHRPVPFYLRRPFWDIVLQALGVSAEVLTHYNQPRAAFALNVVARSANREVIPADNVQTKIDQKILVLTTQLQAIDEDDEEERALIQAKLELIVELRHDLGITDVNKTHH